MAAPGTSPLSTRPGDIVPLPGDAIRVVPAPEPNSNVPQHLSHKHPDVAVLVETAPESGVFAAKERLDWMGITLGLDGSDTTASIGAGLDDEQLTGGGQLGNEHLVDLVALLTPDRRIRIQQNFGTTRPSVYFEGRANVASPSWTDRGQSATFLCLDEGQEILRKSNQSQLVGQLRRAVPNVAWQPIAPDHKPVAAEAPVFNPSNRPNRSSEAYEFTVARRTHLIHLFVDADSPGAARWSYADALRYVIFFYVHEPLLAVNALPFLMDAATLAGTAPNVESADPFVRKLTAVVNDLGVQSTNAEEALVMLVDAAGMHYELATRTAAAKSTGPGSVGVDHWIRVFAPLEKPDDHLNDAGQKRAMISPRPRDIPREAPWTDMTNRTPGEIARANRAVQAAPTIDRRVVTVPTYVGGAKRYEVTLLLRPGWTPHEFLDMPDFVAEAAAEETSLSEEELSEKIADWRKAAIDFWENEFGSPPDDDTGVPFSIYNARHPEHHTVSDVGRLWVFPDDTAYIDDFTSGGGGTSNEVTSPLARVLWPAKLYSPYDVDDPQLPMVLHRADIGGDIFDAFNWLPRPRPFRDTIGRAEATAGRTPVVHFNFSATDPLTALKHTALDADSGLEKTTWVRTGLNPTLDGTRAALTIKEANLLESPLLLSGPEGLPMIEAYIEGRFSVAITCVIEGDDRLSHTARPTGGSFSRPRYATVDVSDRFRFENRRGQNSFFNEQPPDDPAFERRDDTARLRAFAEREAKVAARDIVSGSFEVFWIDGTYRIGDAITGAAGMGLVFNRYATVIRVEYKKGGGGGFRTVVHLSDLRSAPEVGIE